MDKILIDVRRKLNSGIGRVTQWLVDNITELTLNQFEILYLTNEANQKTYNLPFDKCIFSNTKQLSIEELYDTPKLILQNNINLFINPQFNISPFILTPTLTILHDLWYLQNEKVLPSKNDLIKRFDVENGKYIQVISNWLDTDKAKIILTDEGMAKWKKDQNKHNELLNFIWSQLAIFTFFSKFIVFVSPDVEREYLKYFKRPSGYKTILNSYNNQFIGIESNSPKIFLCLAKLEERKNILTLLNAYEIYCTKTQSPKSLVIAGDEGYDDYALKVKTKIEQLVKLGNDVKFINSANDLTIIELFKITTSLILVSEYESFGLPVIEASLAEIPVITTNVGFASTYLKEVCTFIEKCNPINLSEALLDGHLNYAINKNKAIKAKKVIIEQLEPIKITNQWHTLIKSEFNNSNK